jgi:disulfide bond formation protein DsbB
MAPGIRLTNLYIFLTCVAAMLVVYYLDGYLELEPCPLCMTQRVFVVLCGLFALLALAQNPGLIGRRIYAGLAAVSVIVGGGVAARHVWLQYLPEDQVPACGPSLEYMLESLPFSETLTLVMMGDGNCADVQWTLLGLSIPEQALLLFAALLAANLWQLRRAG